MKDVSFRVHWTSANKSIIFILWIVIYFLIDYVSCQDGFLPFEDKALDFDAMEGRRINWDTFGGWNGLQLQRRTNFSRPVLDVRDSRSE